MRIGLLILPTQRWSQARESWRLAEDLDFAHAWTFDHIAWRSLPESPWFSAVPTLAAAACATSRIQLGVLVASPNFRHPVTLVKDFVALHDLSGGRMVLGLGAGATTGPDVIVLGDTPTTPQRHRRFVEFVHLTGRLLREERVSFQGEFYDARNARITPDDLRPTLPLAIAASGPRGIGLAVEHATTWVTNTVSAPGSRPAEADVAVLRRQIDHLRRRCEAVGRDPGSIRRLILVSDREYSPLQSSTAFENAFQMYSGLGFTDLVVPFPRSEPPFIGKLETLERVAKSVLRETLEK